jgi:hypothetical protein
VAARRDLPNYLTPITKGKRFRVERVLRGGDLRLTDASGTKYIASRGHFDLVRKLAHLPPGSQVKAAEEIRFAASGAIIFPKDAALEVVATERGYVKVIDLSGYIYTVHPAQLDVESLKTDPTVQPPPPLSAESAEVYEHIRRLAQLHEDGTISDEEFQSKKAELLKRL